jgi:repressor LexA
MRTPGELNDRHQQILAYIRRYQAERGYPPTMREIGAGIGVGSTSLVTFYLRRLEREGLLQRARRVARSVRVVERKVEV